MARGRPRASDASTAKSTPAKRALSPGTPLRHSKRVKSASATPNTETKPTPKKSIYFEQSSGSEPDTDSYISDVAEESGYEDGDASDTDPDPASDEYASSEDEKPQARKSKGKGVTASRGTHSSARKGNLKTSGAGSRELWREGVKSHLEPGQEVFVELPKARPAGKTPYREGTIHPNTLLFLADLKANNDRAWLKTHDADFRQSERDWKSFVEMASEKLIEVDDTIPELPVKDIIFRIYRDIRFSPDPTPYKPHFSVAWSRTGRKGPFAAYYLQISRNNSFFGGGLWMPGADKLTLLRKMIDRRAGRLKNVLMQDAIRKSFLDGVARNEARVVKAFAKSNKENALKKKPKDYDADHPEIELLKLKNFTLGCKLKDDEIISPKFMDRLVSLMRDMEPYIAFLNSIVMPDTGNEDNNNDEEDEEEGEGSDDEGDEDDGDIGDDDVGEDGEDSPGSEINESTRGR